MSTDAVEAGRPQAGIARPDPPLHRGWATIDGDWDRFYREFPGTYDRFAISTDLIVAEMREIADFDGTNVLVLAAGT